LRPPRSGVTFFEDFFSVSEYSEYFKKVLPSVLPFGTVPGTALTTRCSIVLDTNADLQTQFVPNLISEV
jgi:hypothetical protein